MAWPLYRIYGHAFEAMKTMVVDDGAAVFKRLEEDNGGPIEVLTPEVSAKHTHTCARAHTHTHARAHTHTQSGCGPRAACIPAQPGFGTQCA